jgi:hypothetical protein
MILGPIFLKLTSLKILAFARVAFSVRLFILNAPSVALFCANIKKGRARSGSSILRPDFKTVL